MATSVKDGVIQFVDFSFNTKYHVPLRTIKEIKNLLCNKTFFDNFSLLFQSFADYINGIKYYPVNLSRIIYVQTGARIKIGNVDPDLSAIGVNKITDIEKAVELTHFTINEYYHNFLDYEGYTKIDLYVPYFGFFNIPVNEVMGKILYIYISIDLDTGIATLYLQVEGRVIMTMSNKLGIDVPIGASNLSQIFKDNIFNVTKIAGGIGTAIFGEGLAKIGGLAVAGTGALNMIANSTLHYQRGSLSGGTDALASPTTTYLIIKRPNVVPVGSDYNHIKGRPLNETKTLSTLHGFTIIDDVHLEGFDTALDEELKDIQEQMRRGIIL